MVFTKRVTVDESGTPVVGGGGSGGSGTEYAEDAPSAANPVGGQTMLRRRDTLTAAEVSADGDVIAQNGTGKGEAYIKDVDLAVLVGPVTETAPATDTASSGANGRLQRVAQRLTALIALLPAALGAGGGLKVDGSGTALPVSGTVAASSITTSVTPGTAAGNLGKAEDAAHTSGDTGVMFLGVRQDTAGTSVSADGDYHSLQFDGNGNARVNPAQIVSATSTLANVAGSASSVTLLSLNTSRIRAYIKNDSTAVLDMKYGSTASATSFTQDLQPGETWVVDDGYTGIITGIWASATGNARTTELTP